MKKRTVIYFIIFLVAVTMLSGCSSSDPVKYTLEISQDGEGTVKPAVGKHQIIKDTIVTLSADPAKGYEFEGWAGPDLSKISEENKILLNKNMKIKAVFKKIENIKGIQFSVTGGTYTESQSVELSTTTADAEIYYTTDGSDPSETNGTLYSGAITVNDDTTLKAVALKSGMTDSSIASADYVINYSLTLSVDPTAGGSVTADPDKTNYKYNDSVELTAAAESGYEFSSWSGDLSGSANPETLTIDGSKSVAANFTALGVVSEPVFSVTGGTYTESQSVELSTTTADAEIYYITDGSNPSAANGTLYSGAITVNDDTTLKAVALKSGMTDSSIASADYVINYSLTLSVDPTAGGSVTADPDKTNYKYNDSVELTAAAESGYEFSSWSGDLSGSANPETLTIDGSKSVAANFTALGVVSEPVFSVTGGTYTESQSVELSTTTADAEIYYITDGSNPSAANGTLYSGAITVNDDTTLKAIALKSGMTDSSIASADYVINYSLTLSVDPTAGGSVTADPDKTNYKYNDSVELTAAAESGYEFSSWSGDLSGSANPETLTIDGSKSVAANFTAAKYNLIFTVYDEADNSLNGASVDINGEIKTTDIDGKATYSLISESYSYTVSFDDYETENGNVDINNANTSANVVLSYYASTSAELAAALENDNVAVINLDSSEYDISDSSLSINSTKELKSTTNTTIYLNLEQNISNISTQNTITMINKVKSNLTLSSDINTGLDTIIESGTLDLSGQQLNINGSLFHKGGTILVNAGIVDITGDYLIQESDGVASTGYLEMKNVSDQVIVAGNFVMDSRDHSNRLTAGVLEIKGDFTQRSNSTSSYSYENFDTTDSHRVLLSGVDQTVSFEDPASGNSHFAELELANTGTLIFETEVPVKGKLIPNQSNEPQNSKNLNLAVSAVIEGEVWDWDLSLEESWTLGGNVQINGDYYLNYGTIDLAGHTMNIGGTIFQPDGTINVNGGTLDITGDYLIQESDGVASTGYLEMKNVSDQVIVAGNFVMDSRDHSNRLTAGVLEIKGNFTQRSNSTSNYSYENFDTTDSHRVLLSGVDQTVSFEDPASGHSHFAELELANTGTLIFETLIPVKENLIPNQNNEPQNSKNLYLAGNALLAGGVWDWDLSLEESWTLGGNVQINGDYYLNYGTIDLAGYTMNIGGTIFQPDGTINVNGGTLDITGDYLIQESDGVASTGYLEMKNVSDQVIVAGNFVMDSRDHSNRLTAGVLEIKGNFTQRSNSTSNYSYENFDTTDSHRVLLSGVDQTVSFEDPASGHSHFAELELANTGTLIFETLIPVKENLIPNQNNEPQNSKNLYLAGNALLAGGVWDWDLSLEESWTLGGNVQINGDYYLNYGTIDLAGYTMNIGGTIYQPDGTINVNGGTLDITGDYLIQESDGVASTGYLEMKNVSDQVIVAGNFVMDSRDHSNRLTAGVLEIKGDFTQRSNSTSSYSYENFDTTDSHRVLLSGVDQTVSFEDPASGHSHFAELELANTGTLIFETEVPVKGKLIPNQSNEPQNSKNLNLAVSAVIEGEVWDWDLSQEESWTLGGNVQINGDYYLNTGTVALAGYTMNIGGTIYQPDGTINVNGGTLDITGDYLIQESDGVASTGYLEMKNVSDQVIVAGNFVMDSRDHTNRLTAGVLEVKGNFTQKSNSTLNDSNETFDTSESHKVLLSGVDQTVSFEDPHSSNSHFTELELASIGTVTFASKAAVTGKLISSLSSAPVDSKNLYPAGTAIISGGTWQWDLGINENWILQQDQTVEGDLHIFNGSVDENVYTLTVVGSEIVY